MEDSESARFFQHLQTVKGWRRARGAMHCHAAQLKALFFVISSEGCLIWMWIQQSLLPIHLDPPSTHSAHLTSSSHRITDKMTDGADIILILGELTTTAAGLQLWCDQLPRTCR